ncbi:MAG: ketoacyl-ACP synthase III [bacterium]|nr:ketoacyl-ACP synthase III [bacterium]
MRIKIAAIEYFLPDNIVTNEMLGIENPNWDMARLAARVGVIRRHVAKDDETALDLAIKACDKLFVQNPGLREKVDGLIFCTESEDYLLPPNSCILHKHFNLPENVLAFDFNLACSGYVYGLALAEGLILSGRAKNILLVNADTYSKYINKQDRSTRVLFGDGSAVSWLCAAEGDQGIVDILCATAGKNYDKLIIPAGGCRQPRSPETVLAETDHSGNVRTLENIRMDGMGILTFVNAKVPKQIRDILANNGQNIDQIDLFIFHQASNMALDSLQRILKIDSRKVFRNLEEIGNTVSASIPIALKDASNRGLVKAHSKVLLSGFGVGLSYATALVQY